jgi:hypothetical protein
MAKALWFARALLRIVKIVLFVLRALIPKNPLARGSFRAVKKVLNPECNTVVIIGSFGVSGLCGDLAFSLHRPSEDFSGHGNRLHGPFRETA